MKNAGRLCEWTGIYWKTHEEVLILKDKDILIREF